MILLRVAVPAPLRRTFDYAPGAIDPVRLRPGVRVRVPFGRREQVGVVLEAPREVTAHSGGAPAGVPAYDYKAVAAVLDEEPLLDEELLAL